MPEKEWPKYFNLGFKQYVNQKLTNEYARFQRGRGMRDQIANICWIMENGESKGVPEIYLLLII